MSDREGNEQELFVKQMVRQIMKDQLNEWNTGNMENNHSYVFLENKTLNMVLLYLLMKEERRTNGEMDGEDKRHSEEETIEKLEQAIADTKKEFEETITLLKEKLL
ncbi:hypothetical protein MHZ95_10525 [Sporosarcina sp. ACRSM]|uniref:hypothetical protein n=1 Tax=Sporosarcina sp. ACRSM TaxID=2918216 RepID=UPI001EF7151A|nr:hypothetical protein [Sporosarcina sp. ACRSM]MCG7335713.1 hypothetical protein [Sporosarcina sp. ACRSM]